MTTNKQLQNELEVQARAAYLTLNDGQGVGISNSVVDELRDGARVIENVGEFLKEHADYGLFNAAASDIGFAIAELKKLTRMINDVCIELSARQCALETLDGLNSKKD